MKTTWTTKRVRTQNIRPGDTIDYLNLKTRRSERIRIVTVDAVMDPVIVRLGGRYKGRIAAYEYGKLVRVRRRAG